MVTRPFALFPELEQDVQMFRKAGVLPSQHIRRSIECLWIRGNIPIQESQIQPASIDLRLGLIGYQVRASFLPGDKATVLSMVKELAVQELDLSEPTVLQKGAVYIVPLVEELNLPGDILGKSNPRSTIGRLDALARLLTDYAGQFDRVPKGYTGKLYLEVAPRSFNILVRAGTRLNQLRLMRGVPSRSDTNLMSLRREEAVAYRADGTPARPTIAKGLWLSVDLGMTSGRDVIGLKAAQHAPAVDLDKIAYYDPREFWEPIRRPSKPQFILNPGEFYILGSRERVRIPPSFAAEMVPYDPAMGEFRVHYAGFFDPGFGHGRRDIKGTPVVLEVRSHEVPYVLKDGQHIGRLIYESLLEVPDKIYGPDAGSSYQYQELGLSKQFKQLAFAD